MAALVSLAAHVVVFGGCVLPLFTAIESPMSFEDILTDSATGLLLSVGLGFVIPEGVEAVIKASNPDGSSGRADFPVTTIATSLLVGFTLMLVTEKLLPGAHFHIPASRPISSSASTVEFDADAELRDVERSARTCDLHPPAIRTATGDGPTVPVPEKDFAITLGLVLHALFDGLALGSSAVVNPPSKALIIQVLAIYKAYTLLLLTYTFSESVLHRANHRKYLAIFAIATPVCAILTGYSLLFFRSACGGNNDWSGIAMLVSGGSFLYMAAAPQAVDEEETWTKLRLAYLAWGMFTPQIGRAISA